MNRSHVSRALSMLRCSLASLTEVRALAAVMAVVSETASTGVVSAPPVPIPPRGVDYRGKVVLAPMVRSGELPSRLLALKYGVDLVFGPETVDRSMIGCTMRQNPRTGCLEWSRVSNGYENVLYRIDPAREAGKLIFQVGTNSPERAVEAMKQFAPYVSGIDVNAGCPKPFSTDGGMGAALLKTPDLLASVLRALVEEVGSPFGIGISVKIRLLATPDMTAELVHKLCSTGITGLTIHCRTAPMRKTQRVIRDQLRMVGDICRSHGVACLMNGDITDREHGEQLVKEFGVDGAMIATAAEANSSIFRPAAQGGKAPWQEVVEEYIKLAISVENKFGNTKFLLSQLVHTKSPAYQLIQQSRTYSDLVKILEYDDDEIRAQAAEVDKTMCLDVPRRTAHDIKKENKRLNKERQLANIAKTKALDEQMNARKRQKRQASSSPEPSRRTKTDVASENTGFGPSDGVDPGIMAVAG